MSRTDTELLFESCAEMANIGIAHRHGSFGNADLILLQNPARRFQAVVAETIKNTGPEQMPKTTLELGGIQSHLGGQLLEPWGSFQVADKYLPGQADFFLSSSRKRQEQPCRDRWPISRAVRQQASISRALPLR